MHPVDGPVNKSGKSLPAVLVWPILFSLPGCVHGALLRAAASN